MRKYVELESPKGTIYLREDKLDELAKVDTIVFDCDGVLLDVQNAYNIAISSTTRIIIEAFTGTIIPEEIFDCELNFAFKRTGGFNNDWAHAYALIMRILSELPEENLAELNGLAKESLQYELPKDRFDHIAGNVKANIPIEGLYKKLTCFAFQLDETGIKKVDELILLKVGVTIKKAFKFWGNVGESIISTLFEELYAGAELYRDSFGTKPCFVNTKKGIVETSEVVIQNKTLDELESILNGSRFGIASGSPGNTARYVLKQIMDRFPEKGQYWYDMVARDEERLGEINLHKPNAYSLQKASEPYNPDMVLFIGDTIADYLTAENAGEGFLFAGIYGGVNSREMVKNRFLEIGCNIVAPTVNEIPQVLRYARGEIL
ncbi:MAG: HAD family hydrolase [Promethearchaeota archaeon]